MVNEVIVEYLKSNRRLVVPGVGAFLRKEDDGKVVFVEFLRKDDGVLTRLLRSAYSFSGLEAQEAVDRFAAELARRAATRTGYVISGLGVMRTDANGVCDLEYDPKAQASIVASAGAPAQDSAAAPASSGTEGRIPADRPVTADPPVGASSAVPTPSGLPVQPASQPARPAASDPAIAAPSARPGLASSAAAWPSGMPGQDARPATRPASEAASDLVRPPQKTENIPARPSGAMQEEFDVKRMQYQKPTKPLPDGRKKKADMFMMIAIAAAVIAILAMVYGMLAEKQNNLPVSLPEQAPMEQTAPGSSAN